jgi:lipopolysaccharide assembly outer membrane protein LptD (OstA)
MILRIRAPFFISAFAACLALTAPAFGQAGAEAPPAAEREKIFPEVEASGDSAIRVGAYVIEQTAPNRYRFSGDVDVRFGDLRLQADEVEYDADTHQCRARGNVVLEEGSSFITGDRIEINLETRLSTIHNAYGEMKPDLILEAERLEKIGEDRYRIEEATLTSCTQPTPYWSFHFDRGTVELGGYAHLRNLSFRVGRVPVIYTPYLLWPVKEDRASGFLMPQVGYSQRRGFVLNTAYFWAPARNFDSTFFFDYMDRNGLGTGVETRWLPTQKGRMRFSGYYVDEKIEDPNTDMPEGERYRYRLFSDQPFAHGWRLLADLNEVSDFDYYLDFERDLRAATNSNTTSTLDLSRAWSYYSLNIRGERREQLLSSNEILTQHRQPEVEIRARSRQLGDSPFYLSFEASAAALERDFSYGRFDVFPQIRVPMRPASWLKITPELSVRQTYYTRQRDPSLPGASFDESLRRSLFRGGLEILGPSFSRVWDTPRWSFSPRLKNVLEPKITYSYVPADVHGVEDGTSVTDPNAFVPQFDEVDVVSADLHQVTYSLSSRWFALRSGAAARSGLALPRRIPLPGLAPDPQTADEAATLAPAPGSAEEPDSTSGTPVEFATVTLSQTYSFNRDLSLLFDESSTLIDTSSFSPGNLSIRLNPTARHSVNLTARYNILRRTVEQTTISTDLRVYPHVLSLNWVLSNNITNDQSQVRLFAGTALFRQKLALATELDVDIATSKIQDQRYRVGYNTQCCGFLLEYLGRDFDLSEEREVRFLVNLRGVGKLFDMQQGMR